MNRHRLFFSVLLIVLCNVVATAQGDFSTLDGFKKSVERGEDRITIEANGDLTGDVIETKSKGDGKPTITKRRKRFGLHLLKDFPFLNTFGTS